MTDVYRDSGGNACVQHDYHETRHAQPFYGRYPQKTLIINLPGSPKAVKESLEYIIDALGHGIEIMTGEAGNCAR